MEGSILADELTSIGESTLAEKKVGDVTTGGSTNKNGMT